MPKLVAIGDSLTQGFQSFAITYPQWSFPSMIADSMGLSMDQFRVPNFSSVGGLPLNIEWLARRLEERYGANLNVFEWARAVFEVTETLDLVEDYWERGPGSKPVVHRDYHNLAVWGWEVGDAFALSAEHCRSAFGTELRDDRLGIPSSPRLRTGHRVLNPSHDTAFSARTQLAAAQALGSNDDPIEHLIIWLGANNCLGTVIDLEIRETPDDPPGPLSNFNLWSEEAFRKEYEAFAEHVAKLDAKNVYVGTVPHVTIPPITRGVMDSRGQLPQGSKYFDYYTRFWIHDKLFDPNRDPYLTGDKAEYIDKRIDTYNDIIRAAAHKHGWYVVDTCKMLDELAVRRNHGTPKRQLPPALSDLSIRLFEINGDGTLKCGGLISLDGIHPTTCGYALVADEFLKEMNQHGANARRIDFAEVRRWDTLVSRPPRTLDDILGMLRCLERYFHISKWLSKGVMPRS